MVSQNASPVNLQLGGVCQDSVSFLFFFKLSVYIYIYLCIYLWLCWVFVSVRRLSLVAASGGHSSSRCAGLSLSRPLLLRSRGSRRAGSVIVAHGPSCSVACGIFPDQGSNPCALHWQAVSQPLRHQGSPTLFLFTQTLGQGSPSIKPGGWEAEGEKLAFNEQNHEEGSSNPASLTTNGFIPELLFYYPPPFFFQLMGFY